MIKTIFQEVPDGTIKTDKHTISIYQEQEPTDPRKYDNLSLMYCWHNHYCLGDEQLTQEPRKFLKELEQDDDVLFIGDLYLYDHSGITISMSPFICPWDSGQVGFIVVRESTLLKHYSKDIIKTMTRKELKEICLNEVATYDQYLTGDVWRIECDTHDDLNIWGLFGFDDVITYINDTLNTSLTKNDIKEG